MSQTRSLWICLVMSLLFICPPAFADDPPKPNIILFLVDDLGWTDISCHKIIGEDNLAARWKLDGDATDSSGNGRDGVLVNGPVWTDEGKVDGAIQLDGENDYIETPYILNPSEGSFSAFAWVKDGGSNQVILTQIDTNGTGRIWLNSNADGNLETDLQSATYSPLISVETGHTDGDWHHLGVVWDYSTGTRHLYLDGVRVAYDGTSIGNLESCEGAMYLGTNKVHNNNFWNGLMDEVRIYSRALSEDEIRGLSRRSSYQLDDQFERIASSADSAEAFDSTFYETPNLSRLREQGMRFTSAYAYPFCAPTRAALMTGKYPAKLKMTDHPHNGLRKSDVSAQSYYTNLIPGFARSELPLDETTIAEALKGQGYMTCHVGKWNLYSPHSLPTPDDYMPDVDRNGFNYNIGGSSISAPPTYYRDENGWPAKSFPNLEVPLNWTGNSADFDFGGGKFFAEKKYLTDALTHRALEFIDMSQTKDKPFFLYMSHFGVHGPFEAKDGDHTAENYVAHFPAAPTGLHSNATFAAMIKSVDESLGLIQSHLENLNEWNNTVVIFLSDNGGMEYNHDPAEDSYITMNDPLLGGKSVIYGGGVRVPMIVYWPNLTTDGSIQNRVCDEPVHVIDVFPTLLAAAGVADNAMPDDLDGENLENLIDPDSTATFTRENDPDDPDDDGAIFIHYPHTRQARQLIFDGLRDCAHYPCTSVFQNGFRLIKFYEPNSDAKPKAEKDPRPVSYDTYTWEDANFDTDTLQLEYNYPTVKYELYSDNPWINGKVGVGALAFSGFDYIKADGYQGISGGGARTCAAWIKIDKDDLDTMDIFYWGVSDPANTGRQWRIRIQPNDIDGEGYLCAEVGGGYIYYDSKNIADGQWHHIAVVVPDSTTVGNIQLFVDGTMDSSNLVISGNNVAINTAEDSPVLVGNSVYETPFIGCIDDVRIYSRALSDTEINNLYGLQNVTGSLVLHWKLDETSGTTVNDDSDSTKNGLMVNAFFDFSEKVNLYADCGDPDCNGSCGVPYCLKSHELKDLITNWQVRVDAQMPQAIAVNVTQGTIYTGINKAIAAAATQEGDTIKLCRGTHEMTDETPDGGGIDINKNIILQSIDPKDPEIVETTILNAGNDLNSTQPDILFNKPIVKISSTSGCTIKGFTIGGALVNSDGGTSSDGGAIYGNGNAGTIENCIIRDNKVHGSGAGIYNFDGTIRNCFIVKNTADANANGIGNGGGLAYCDGSIINCTIADNTGEGIYDGYGSSITNCIVWGNNDDLNGCTATYSCIEDGDAGTGNINSDPDFVDDGYHLSSDSPCVDAGDPSGVYTGFDIDGEVRVVDGDDDGTPRVDMGADEVFFGIVLSSTQEGDFGYRHIQSAIGAASEGDEIVVYPGTYYEAIDFNSKSITVRSVDPTDWDIVEATVIDGNSLYDHVVTFENSEDANSILSGFTITGGNADSTGYDDSGAGIFCDETSPTIQNCLIKDNYAAQYGGGMYAINSNTEVSNCIFENNSTGTDSSEKAGGAFRMYGGQPVIKDCIFEENDSVVGGAIQTCGSRANISNCTFLNNEATTGGGAIRSTKTDGGIYSLNTIKNCLFVGNSADSGGAIHNNSGSNNKITNCTFKDNIATDGGGIRNHYSTPIITNSVFFENTSNYGGAIYNYASSPALTNCTFTENVASTAGGGIRNYSESDPIITNCILWSNTGGEITNSNSTPTVNYNCISGWISGGTGNINTDPSFVDDYYLSISSPCIDAGDPSGDYTGQTDIEGDERVIGNRVDMGADESDYGLVHYQAMDESSGTTSPDTSGYDNDGTLINGPVWMPSGGIINGCLAFDGINDLVQTPFIQNPAAGSFSAFAWVKGGGSAQVILTQIDDNNNGVGRIWLNTNSSGYLTSVLQSSSSGALISSEKGHTDGGWHHVGIVWDYDVDATPPTGRRFLYLDGVRVAYDGTSIGNLESCEGAMYLGTNKVHNNNFWNGLIDDVRIYNRALSASEIQALAQ